MLIESGNPLHSVADSQTHARGDARARAARSSIDVALSETRARGALRAAGLEPVREGRGDVLQPGVPAQRLPPAPPGDRAAARARSPEPEIHARLVEAMGELTERRLRAAACARRPKVASRSRGVPPGRGAPTRALKYAPIVLYRTLGPTLPEGMESAAVLLGLRASVRAGEPRGRRARRLRRRSVHRRREALRRDPRRATGVVFSDERLRRELVAHPHAATTINLAIPELLGELDEARRTGRAARDRTIRSSSRPASAARDTTNTIIRNPASLAKERAGTLRMSPARRRGRSAAPTATSVRLSTRRGSAEVPVEVTDMMQPGHISLPNGEGMDYEPRDAAHARVGVAPNELTACGRARLPRRHAVAQARAGAGGEDEACGRAQARAKDRKIVLRAGT